MAKLLHPDNTVTGAPNHILVVNEEGKLHGLPFNLFATRVFAAANGSHDAIVSPALLCKTSEVK